MQTEANTPILSKIEGHSFDGSALNYDSVVIDIGANRGLFALEIMRRYDCLIESFEPDTTAFTATSLRMLSDRAFVHQRAVAGRSGLRDLYCAEPLSGGNSIIPGHAEYQHCAQRARTYPVYAVSMESILKRHANIDLIKFDCEGAEFEIFENTPIYLWRRVKQITIEFHEFCFEKYTQREVEKVCNLLSSIGFEQIEHDNLDSLFIRKR